MSDQAYNPTPGSIAGEADLPETTVVEEFHWLMSLALDDLLAVDDRARFDDLLRRFSGLAAMWASWRAVADQMAALPCVEPAPGFVNRFEHRLAQRQQIQQSLVYALVGAAVLFAGVVVGVAVTGLFAFVLMNQGPWIGQQIYNFVFAAAAIDNWFNFLARTAAALATTPQAQTAGLAYVVFAFLIIVAWMRLLRRSARLAPAVSGVGME